MVPLWLLSLTLMVALTATNMVSARSYGEFEYWFSSIKVIAIALFLGMGVLRLTLGVAAKVVLDNVSATLSGIRAGC